MTKLKILPLKFIIVAILVIGIPAPRVYGGTYFDKGFPEEKSDRARSSFTLEKAEKAFMESNYEDVVNIGNSYLARRTKLNDELQYLTGRALLKLGRFDEARNRFSSVVNYSKSDNLLDKAYIGLADSYFLEGDYKKAKEHYEKVMRYFPDSDDMCIVYYRLGECYAKLDKRATSEEFYDKLVKLYPDSLEARLLVGEKSDFVTYSVQVGSFKKWNNAKKLHDELKNKGFDVNIYTTILGNTRFYRVRVGQYDRLSDAEDMARTLRNRGYSVKIYP